MIWKCQDVNLWRHDAGDTRRRLHCGKVSGVGILQSPTDGLQTVLDLWPQHIPVCKGRVQSKGGNVEIYTLGSRPPHGSVPKGLMTTMYLSQCERSACHTWRHLQTCPCCHTISREKEGAELAGQGGLSRLSVSARWCEQNIRELKIFRPSF